LVSGGTKLTQEVVFGVGVKAMEYAIANVAAGTYTFNVKVKEDTTTTPTGLTVDDWSVSSGALTVSGVTTSSSSIVVSGSTAVASGSALKVAADIIDVAFATGGTSGPGTYTFTASTDLAAVAQSATIAAGTTYVNGYFEIFGSANKRANSATYSLEVQSSGAGGLRFTTSGTSKVTFVASGTGSSGVTAIALKDASGVAQTESTGKTGDLAADTAQITFVFENLPAGTYSIVGAATARGARVYSVEVVED